MDVRGLLSEFEQTQWMPDSEREEAVTRQLAGLVNHARRTVPYYEARYDQLPDGDTVLDRDRWAEVPLLTRTDIQFAGALLHSRDPGPDHGAVGSSATSGSTGRPILALGTPATRLFWAAITVRDHLWHRRDFLGKLATIRDSESAGCRPPDGAVYADWGEATRQFIATGPCAVLDVHSSTEEQADWLARQNPDYLLTHPSIVHCLAETLLARGERLPQLRQIRTFGEVLDDETRRISSLAFDVQVADAYSTGELGYLALQCPEHEHFHVQAEAVYLEILRDDGTPCEVGETGRVVVTSFTNRAMPLIRYEVGDFAEVGPPCPCGRTLPVLKRIVGRSRNMVLLPDGSRRWPSLSAGGAADKIREFPPIQQFQLVQRTLHDVEVFLVMHRPLTATEEAMIRVWAIEGLGYPFDLRILYVDEIPRSPGGKFEDFRCEVQRERHFEPLNS